MVLIVALSGCQEPGAGTGRPGMEAGEAGVPAGGIDRSLMDPSVAPGDDFYRHANGAWLESFKLPPDLASFGAFREVFETSQERVRSLIEELSMAGPPAGSIEQKIGDYYASFMDTATVDAAGFEPIAGELEVIAGIDTVAALTAAFGRSEREETDSPIRFGIEIDRKNPARFIASLGHGGLGLPERDYYLEESERFASIREAYQHHIARMLNLVDRPAMAELAAQVLALETEIARAHWPRADRRNRDLTYNLHTYRELTEKYTDFDWREYFEAVGVVPEVINVNHPGAMAPLIGIVNRTPLPVWRAYLAYHLVAGNAAYLAGRIDEANFDFYGKVLQGQEEQRPRWRRAVQLVSGRNGLGDAVGQVYVGRYFPARSKALMEELVENLRAAFRERITDLDWMGEETRTRALEKLEAFLPKIGYPEEWRDYTDVRINRNDLMANVRNLRRYYEADGIARLSRPTDRNEWFMPAHTVNAFYNPSFNAITFPAGILAPPFFDPEADPALNYGAIGAVIGHEMGHGFDDQGSKVDARGVQENWWTDEDRARFEERTAALVRQYSNYEPVPGIHIDGAFTLGENIGDLGGLEIAYHAYRASLGGVEPPVLDGFTGDERFFLAFAQVWRSKMREELLVARLKSDPHSPPPYRANGVVRNVDAFYRAFGVGEDAALYLPPGERVRIW